MKTGQRVLIRDYLEIYLACIIITMALKKDVPLLAFASYGKSVIM